MSEVSLEPYKGIWTHKWLVTTTLQQHLLCSYICYTVQPQQQACWMRDWELKQYQIGRETLNVHTVNFGWNLHPHVTYSSSPPHEQR